MDNFSFSESRVLETLLNAKKRGMEFMGSATSDFQSNPRRSATPFGAAPRSDWEMQVYRIFRDQTSKILGQQDMAAFPHFFSKKDLYVKRCVELRENMFRLSFDFGRLCPKPGEFDVALMREYISVLALVRDQGLEPMVTLYHWPSPAYLLKLGRDEKVLAGAWEHEDILYHFQAYLQNVLHFLTDRDFIRQILQRDGYSREKQDKLLSEGLVRYFISVNEPINLLLPTYILGLFPPFKKLRFDLAKKVLRKLILAHDMVITEIRNSKLPAVRGPLKIGASHNWTFFDGLFKNFFHSLVNAKLARRFEQSQKETDFIGLHYFFRLKLSPFGRHKKVYGDDPYFGDVHPPGMFKVLKQISTEYPGKDIFVTEFGFSDSYDHRRPYWILETMRQMIDALTHQIPVKGVLLWTLVNNFEWNLGMQQKFGLFEESELSQPLVPSTGEKIKSWEVWSAATRTFLEPTRENLAEMQRLYELAKRQFQSAIVEQNI